MFPTPYKPGERKGTYGSGYVRGPDGKWAWNLTVQPNLSRDIKERQQASILSRTPSDTSIEFLNAHTVLSSRHPSKEVKLDRSATSRNVVGEEFKSRSLMSRNGIEIWRIENSKAKPLLKEDYGKFYSGDSYIVLSSSLKNGTHHIHFWIGKSSTQEKYATAAYKAVELDNHFTGGAIQHREDQGNESELFKGLFPNGITYLEGGVSSWFRHVKREEFSKRLLRLKGKRDVRIKQMELSHESLNLGDVFILDLGRTIFQFNGPLANRAERVKGVEVIRSIKDNERGGRVQIIVIDYQEDEKSNDPKKMAQFWEALGAQGKVASAESAGDDVEYEKSVDSNIRVQRFKEEANQVSIEEYTERPLKKEMLDSHYCFFLDVDTEVFCWTGKATSTLQKNYALEYAKAQHQDKPKWVQLIRVVQGAETPLFKERFSNWRELFPKNVDYSAAESYLPKTNTASAVRSEEKIDVAKLLAPNVEVVPQPDKGLLHDCTGTLKVWRVHDFKKVEVPETWHGVFFDEESYICVYMEMKDKRRCHYIYFWQGRHCPMETKGACALLVKEIAETIRGKCTQFRVVQGKEPEHFLMLCKPKKSAVIGGQAVQGKARDCVYPVVVGNGAHRGREGYAGLYHIKQTSYDASFEWNTKAVQVANLMSNLNSNDAFVQLGKDGKCFVWNGAGSSPAEKRVARAVAQRLVGDANVGRIVVIDETREPNYFWKYFDDVQDAENIKRDYPCVDYLKRSSLVVRLFSCSNTTGSFKVIEVPNFTQDDLDNDDLFMLDCFAEVFLWVGAGSNEYEKKMAMQTAIEFVAQGAEKFNRPLGVPIFYINAGSEPPAFKCHFLAWDSGILAPSLNPEIEDFIVTKPKPMPTSDSTTASSAASSSSTSTSNTHSDSKPAASLAVDTSSSVSTSISPPASDNAKISTISTPNAGGASVTPSSSSNAAPTIFKSTSSTATIDNGGFKQRAAWRVIKNDGRKVPQAQSTDKVVLVQNELEKYNKEFYTFEELTAKKKPIGVDVTALEKYLTEEEFQSRFGITKTAFYALPVWKRVTMRKDKGLY